MIQTKLLIFLCEYNSKKKRSSILKLCIDSRNKTTGKRGKTQKTTIDFEEKLKNKKMSVNKLLINELKPFIDLNCFIKHI